MRKDILICHIFIKMGKRKRQFLCVFEFEWSKGNQLKNIKKKRRTNEMEARKNYLEASTVDESAATVNKGKY